mgnify:CR=1 FL=1
MLEEIVLPPPRLRGAMSVEEALARRRSVKNLAERFFLEEPLDLGLVAQVLWAAQGVNDVERGLRTVPSAGRSYPLRLYVVVGERSVKVSEEDYLAAGVYRYEPDAHTLVLVRDGDVREELAGGLVTEYNRELVTKAPVSLVIFAVFGRMKYRGERGARYVLFEAGHAAQNVYLQAVALGMGTLVLGAFEDERVRSSVGAEDGERPLYVLPIGLCRALHEVSGKDLESYFELRRGRSGR